MKRYALLYTNIRTYSIVDQPVPPIAQPYIIYEFNNLYELVEAPIKNFIVFHDRHVSSVVLPDENVVRIYIENHETKRMDLAYEQTR